MRFADWWQGLERRLTRHGHCYQLSHRNLYILPSSFGSTWLLVAGVLYVLGVQSRSNGPVLLAFLMAGLVLLSLFLTHLNLQGLELRAVKQRPQFAGDALSYCFDSISQVRRPGIKIRWQSNQQQTQQLIHIPPGRHSVSLPVVPHPRGCHPPGRLCIHTTAPLGLFRCWTYWAPPEPLWIAPVRTPGPVQELSMGSEADAPAQAEPLSSESGADEFVELAPWRPEQGMQRVDWKARARGCGWLTKTFRNASNGEVWLAPAAHLPWERALEHLCARFWEDHHSGRSVGLRLNTELSIPPGTGQEHLERGLRYLAQVQGP